MRDAAANISTKGGLMHDGLHFALKRTSKKVSASHCFELCCILRFCFCRATLVVFATPPSPCSRCDLACGCEAGGRRAWVILTLLRYVFINSSAIYLGLMFTVKVGQILVFHLFVLYHCHFLALMLVAFVPVGVAQHMCVTYFCLSWHTYSIFLLCCVLSSLWSWKLQIQLLSDPL